MSGSSQFSSPSHTGRRAQRPQGLQHLRPAGRQAVGEAHEAAEGEAGGEGGAAIQEETAWADESV